MSESLSPRSIAGALEALRAGAVPVAGCTDLLVVDHATGRAHVRVVDVTRIEELRGVRETDGALDIGGACTFTEIREHPLVAKHAPALVAAAATIGAWQIQNRATIGGNIANASPAGDSLPVLLALGASVVANGPQGRRSIDYATFHTAYRQTALRPGELIERVRLPTGATVQIYRKVGTREAQAISKVVLAFAARRDGNRLRDVRIGIGSVAATPIRLERVERLIEGGALNEALADRAAAEAEAAIAPIDDVRSTAEYRRYAAGRIVRRFLLELLAN